MSATTAGGFELGSWDYLYIQCADIVLACTDALVHWYPNLFLLVLASDVQGRAGLKSPGSGPAFGGQGLLGGKARPYERARAGPGRAWAKPGLLGRRTLRFRSSRSARRRSPGLLHMLGMCQW